MPLRVLYLIVARGGSRGVPGKNIAEIGGLSLLGYKARAAKLCGYPGRIVVSTDDPRIQDEARAHGVEVPFTRPSELASDTAQTVDVVQHAIEYFEAEGSTDFDAIMLLEPSTPFARPGDLDKAIACFIERDAKLVTGVREVEVNSMFCGSLGEGDSISGIVENIRNVSKLRRQDVPTEYTPNGAFYLFDWRAFKESRKIYDDPDHSFGIVMDRFHSVEIDTPFDLEFAKFVVEQRKVDPADWEPTNGG